MILIEVLPQNIMSIYILCGNIWVVSKIKQKTVIMLHNDKDYSDQANKHSQTPDCTVIQRGTLSAHTELPGYM